VDYNVDLTEIQRVVGLYANQSNFLQAAAPLTAASIAKFVMGKNKIANVALAGGGAWFAIQQFSGPLTRLFQDQFGYLQQIFSAFGG
jgi:hypothetical protein